MGIAIPKNEKNATSPMIGMTGEVEENLQVNIALVNVNLHASINNPHEDSLLVLVVTWKEKKRYREKELNKKGKK